MIVERAANALVRRRCEQQIQKYVSTVGPNAMQNRMGPAHVGEGLVMSHDNECDGWLNKDASMHERRRAVLHA